MSSPKRKRDDATEVRFWGEGAGFSELSNFWKMATPIVYKGKTYATSEHLYQSLKFDYEGAPAANRAHVEAIRTANTAGIAKRLTRINKGDPEWPWQKKHRLIAREFIQKGSLIDPKWEEGANIRAMEIVLEAKFTQCSHCRKVLLSTAELRLVEDSPYDNFWGIGSKEDGENMLGKLLEATRRKLREKEAD